MGHFKSEYKKKNVLTVVETLSGDAWFHKYLYKKFHFSNLNYLIMHQ